MQERRFSASSKVGALRSLLSVATRVAPGLVSGLPRRHLQFRERLLLQLHRHLKRDCR